MNVKVLEPCLEHSKQTKYFNDNYYHWCFLEELIRLCFGINFSFHFWYIGWIWFLYTFLWALNVIMLLNGLIMYPTELYRVKMSQAVPKGNFMVGRSLEQNCSPVSQPCRLRDWEMPAKLSETYLLVRVDLGLVSAFQPGQSFQWSLTSLVTRQNVHELSIPVTTFENQTNCLGCLPIPNMQIGEGNGSPLQCSCLEGPVDRAAWWAAVHGVAKGRTWLSDFIHFSLSCVGEGNCNPLQCSCLENPRDGGSLVGCPLWGCTKSDTTEAT